MVRVSIFQNTHVLKLLHIVHMLAFSFKRLSKYWLITPLQIKTDFLVPTSVDKNSFSINVCCFARDTAELSSVFLCLSPSASVGQRLTDVLWHSARHRRGCRRTGDVAASCRPWQWPELNHPNGRSPCVKSAVIRIYTPVWFSRTSLLQEHVHE